MRLKSYFTATVEEALELARRELGPEAVLVDSRRTAPEARQFGQYEVVFAAGSAVSPETENPSGRLWQEVAGMRAQIEELRCALETTRLKGAPSPHAPWAQRVVLRLEDAGVERALAREIATAVEGRLRDTPPSPGPEGARPDPAAEALREELGSRFSVDATLGKSAPEAGARVLALVGPPGSGKTTTLVKLAVRYGLDGPRPLQILSADTMRIAAAEQLRTLAAVVGVGFQLLENGWALHQALEEHGGKSLILIDTPGFAAGDMDQAEELAAFLSGHPAVDTHLVLPASMAPADLTRVVKRFDVFRPAKLLFTKLDETEGLGPAFSEAVRTGRPLSFLTGGQRIPEDLEPATKETVIDRMTGGRLRVLAQCA